MAHIMWRPILSRREHPAEPMISDVSTATGTNSKHTSNWEYFCLFRTSAANDTENWFKIVVRRLQAENESIQVASQANALPP